MISNIKTFLDGVLGHPESELVEFKLADRQFSERKLWDYFSALSNEANLHGKDAAYLILGIDPKTHTPIHTSSWSWKNDIRDLKNQTHRDVWVGFCEIYEVDLQSKRILVFEIPAAPRGTPIASNGFYYARAGESLVALDLRKLDEIRNQNRKSDWSAAIIPEASLSDLDPGAMRLARENYKQVNSSSLSSAEVDSWSDEEFLNRAKITVKGKITRTTILLLWKPESTQYISPAIAKITWVLKDSGGIEKDYAHFEPPFLLAVDKVASKIRNLRYRYMQEWTLFPEEVDMYDPWIIRELLHNCIAHQDYERAARISVVEFEDGKLIFSNAWDFLPTSVESVISGNSPPETYRNSFLAHAMVQTKMIDTIGSGIKRICQIQSKKFFPLPTFNFDNGKVEVELLWKVLDVQYANILARNSSMTISEIFALDKVQKGLAKQLSKEQILWLKKKWLVEGSRYTNVYLSGSVSQKIGESGKYIRTKGFDDRYYCDLIVDFIQKYRKATKDELRTLLLPKLPESLEPKQKEDKIWNLIMRLAKNEKIISDFGVTKAKKDRVWKIRKT